MTSILLALFASATHGDGDAPGPSWYVIEVPMNNYTLRDVNQQDRPLIDRLAELTFDAFRAHAPDWLPTLDAARDEVFESLGSGRRARAR